MAKFVPDSILDLELIEIQKADEVCVCTTTQPVTYYNAHRPGVRTPDTVTTIGTLKAPATSNGCIYECTIGGTTGSGIPGWNTVQDGETIDGTVTWKTHYNYSLGNTALDPGDKVISDSVAPAGRKLTIAEKTNVICHTDGEVGHMALICSSDLSLKMVTTSETTIVGDNNVVSGRRLIVNEFVYTVSDPA